jgi:hypothetical protein
MRWVDRQLPAADELFLDHIGFFVQDLDAAAPIFERLGFAVTPVNIHHNAGPDGRLERSGTANRLITFRRGYLELLAAVADTPLADQLRAALARYPGLHLLAFAHADAAARAERVARAGFVLQPAVRLRRPVQTAAGERTASFTVVRAHAGEFPEGRVQLLTHETPDLVWFPERCRHPNRADALTDVLLVSEDAAEKADRFGRFTACPAAPDTDRWAVSVDRGRMTFATPRAAERLLPGFSAPSLPFTAAVAVASADLAATRRVLAERGVRPLADREGVTCIGPADAAGAYLIFHAPEADPVWPRLTA